ncbi:hypothetical protein BCR42DRAFT_21975 [Absidia repens]|uniref:Uncharacterized protein n=1 Tax=Absidia repens TaxID=90262 RepID=A0A1X2IHJ9_9FUNG|nr:hypothetical protein BCR42DRAFT_21975 [Absidia repens]
MKTTLAFAIALAIQSVTAASPSPSPSPSPSLASNAPPPSSIGDKVAQDLAENFAIFRWEGNNTLARESFAFELNEPSRLQVVDFKHHGDMFDVFDNGKKLGSSSNVVYDENVETYAATPQEALSDDHFSKGAFSLEKGKHNITVMAHGPYEVGSAALRLVQRTNLVLAKGQDNETEEEHEEEEEEEENEDEKDDDDKGNWQKMYLKKKSDDGHKRSSGKHIKYNGSKHGSEKKYRGQYKNHKHGKSDYRHIPHRVVHDGPKTVTHWKVVRQTAVPYAVRVGYEHGDYE